MPKRLDHPAERPDDLSPEWGEYEARWAVRVADFESPVAAAQFLMRRKEIFRSAEAAGIPKDLLTPFEPDKPGFEERVARALRAFAKSAGLAAE